MDSCPKCGESYGIVVRDPGVVLVSHVMWDGSPDWSELEHTRPVPKTAKCADCGFRVPNPRSSSTHERNPNA